MIYVVEINVPHRTVWGDALSLDVSLPTKIRRIKGVMGNVTPDESSMLRKLVAYTVTSRDTERLDSEGEPISEAVLGTLTAGNPVSPQIGNFSVSVDNTAVVSAATPLCVTSTIRRCSTMRRNMVRFDRPFSVHGGCTVRISIEERLVSPFYDAETYAEEEDACKRAVDEWAKANLGNDNNDINTDDIGDRMRTAVFGSADFDPSNLTNGYTARFYIEYD